MKLKRTRRIAPARWQQSAQRARDDDTLLTTAVALATVISAEQIATERAAALERARWALANPVVMTAADILPAPASRAA